MTCNGTAFAPSIGSIVIPTKSVSINNFRVSKGLRQDGIIPFAMEGIALEIDAAQLLITDAVTFFIPFGVEAGRDGEAGFRFCVADQVDDGHTIEQRATSPVLGNETEHAMLDLIPLARARRKMRDMDRKVESFGQPLQLSFPQADATAVTPPSIGRDIEVRSMFI